MLYHQLPTGHQMPMLGLGTYDLRGTEGTRAIVAALEAGYRHIDTAAGYDNEEAVGRALQQSGLERDSLFVTTKVGRDDLSHDDLLRSCQDSLKRLEQDYVDLLLVHWPNNEIPMEETLGALAQVVDKGLARHVGVSNFTRGRLGRALEITPVPLCANQVEYHPYLNQAALRDFCREKQVALTAYSPLAQGQLLDDKMLKGLGDKYGVSSAQVALRWLLQHGIVAIPKAGKVSHMQSNLGVFDWELDAGDMASIDAIKKTLRVIDWWPGEFDQE
jgi:2,5-diketo-D-gluconate reductase B